jgi:hypothetical protein
MDNALVTRFQAQREEARECFNRAATDCAKGFFVLYQIQEQETYKAEYERWDDFLEDFAHEVKDASRTLMYDRVRLIRRLKSLEWSNDDIMEALESPTVVQEALRKCGDWERGGGFIKLTNGVDTPFYPEDTSQAEAMTEIVKDAMALPRGEGRKYVSERAKEPQIWAKLVDAGTAVSITIVDEDEDQRFEFFHKGKISSRAREYLERVFRARFGG